MTKAGEMSLRVMAVMSEISTPLNKELLQICFCTHGGDLLISVGQTLW